MKIFAHRGWLEKYPENSFIAIKAALDRGVGVELDLRLNGDNDFIIIHDEDLKRLCGVEFKASQINKSNVKQYHYLSSSDVQLCLFSELGSLFEKVSDQLIAIHLKSADQNDIGLSLVAKYFAKFNLYNKAFVFDLTIQSAKKLRALDPKIQLSFIVSDYKFEPTIYTWSEIKPFGDLYDIVWAAEYRKLYSPEFIKEVKDNNKIFYAVSPDLHKALGHPLANSGFEKTWHDLILWQADGICTDWPSRLQKIIG